MHFEQVPLEVVEKMLGGEAMRTATAGTNSLAVKTSPRTPEPYRLGARSIAKADVKPKAAGR
jgi:hypothetical protein